MNEGAPRLLSQLGRRTRRSAGGSGSGQPGFKHPAVHCAASAFVASFCGIFQAPAPSGPCTCLDNALGPQRPHQPTHEGALLWTDLQGTRGAKKHEYRWPGSGAD